MNSRRPSRSGKVPLSSSGVSGVGGASGIGAAVTSSSSASGGAATMDGVSGGGGGSSASGSHPPTASTPSTGLHSDSALLHLSVFLFVV